MRFWFDTEFYEDGRTIELISIGIVAEDGREYYAETFGSRTLAKATPWLEQNVLPHLSQTVTLPDDMRRQVLAFMGEKPEIWAYYADYDWVALCRLFGRMIDLPKGWPMFCRDVKQLAVDLCDPKLPEQTTGEHNALADAIWARDAWLFLRELDGRPGV
jgi:hypothetical protein